MKLRFTQLWRSSGTVGRAPYALIGIFGFAIKHNLDRLVAALAFHRAWGLFNYWIPVRDVVRITQLGGADARFLATMVALSLPFIWIGVMLTMQRLRSAGLPVSLVALFFLPFLNLLFLLILCLVPEREIPAAGQKPRAAASSWLASVVPEGALGSAALSLLVTVPVGFAAALLGAQVFANYGWGLFVALPFTMGFVSVLLYGVRQPRGFASSIGVASLSVVLLGGALLALAMEGVFCLIMALPLALPLGIFGGVCAYPLQKRRWMGHDAPVVLSALLLFAPGMQAIEHALSLPRPAYVVRTSIDIQAPPEKVWREVVAFSEIPAPSEWLFRAGIAYPMRAEMLGQGVGAERHCVFSTGAFVEPIEIWDAPHQLKFSVTSNPRPMEEWTPYHHIEPPHLHGFLVSEGGQFLLTPLPNGGTRLEGTTWYQHGLWPAAYWRLWSDAIIHRIHLRVLRHIRDKAEVTAS
ncbi:MAG TPA: hypothetical protein VMH04_13160 [Candidatus Solibacter sp.]|nr:hypothetical protein [Candidatus Solibacter sp.]